MKSDIILLALLPLLAACGGDAPKNDNPATNTQTGTSSAANDPRPPVYLEGLYATSSAADKEAYDLFDDDPNTGWQTQPGTGPDEGIMLYFADAQLLQSIQVLAEEGSFHVEKALLQTYVNGALGESGKAGEYIPLGDKPVKSLYIRFAKTGFEHETIKREKKGATVQIETFPREEYVGIQSLNILNNKGEPLRLVPPARVRGSVSASSTLEPEIAYSPANLFDSRKEFVWVEGNETTSGEGDTISFGFVTPVRITAVQIWNGYQRSDEHFAANVRLRDFEFGAKGGPVSTYTLRDTKAGQKIQLSTVAEGDSFILKIKNTYPGKRYKDLVISDIVFFDGERPFVLVSKLPQQHKVLLRSRVEGSPLLQLLNRRISNVVNEEDVVTFQSLILRSDGTFVLYSNDVLPDDTESQTLADGNWELMTANGANATVRVFGKWNNVSDFADYYKGKTTQTDIRIFSDELITDGSTVKGKRVIGTFYVR